MDNSDPTCGVGILYSDGAKPTITTTNTTIKAIGCNAAGQSLITPRWYFTSTLRSTLFDYDAVRAGVGHDAGGFSFTTYATPTPADALYEGIKTEFETAIVNARDGQTTVLRNGTYDLRLQEIQRSTSASMVTIRAETPGCYNSNTKTGVTLNGSTKMRFWTDAWTLKGFCFEGISNQSSDGYSEAVQISAGNIMLSQNTFRNIGNSSSWSIAVAIGGGTNLQGEHKYLENDIITHNLFTNIKGIAINLPQPPPVYTGPYVWALHSIISYNTFDGSPLYSDNDGKAIHLGTGWDLSDPLNPSEDYMGIHISRNFFNTWDSGGELFSIKSTGNFIEDNLVNNSLGGISVRVGDHNTIQRNYIINSNPSCYGFRVSGIGNSFDHNFLDLHPLCIAWYWTTKQLDTSPMPENGHTVATYPSKKNYFRWNKVKNAQWIVWLLNTQSNQRWEHNPPTDADLPTINELRLNEFYDLKDSIVFHSDIPTTTASENRIKMLNTFGTDNQYIN